MSKNINAILYNNLKSDKIKINWNKRPIEMDKFLSFLTVPVEIDRDHLGSDTGWTRRKNDEIKLIVCGGCVKGVEYLDSIEFGIELQNGYNNYVNPFALFDILTQDGRDFFSNYYRGDIEDILNAEKQRLEYLKNRVIDAEDTIEVIEAEKRKLNLP